MHHMQGSHLGGGDGDTASAILVVVRSRQAAGTRESGVPTLGDVVEVEKDGRHPVAPSAVDQPHHVRVVAVLFPAPVERQCCDPMSRQATPHTAVTSSKLAQQGDDGKSMLRWTSNDEELTR